MGNKILKNSGQKQKEAMSQRYDNDSVGPELTHKSELASINQEESFNSKSPMEKVKTLGDKIKSKVKDGHADDGENQNIRGQQSFSSYKSTNQDQSSHDANKQETNNNIMLPDEAQTRPATHEFVDQIEQTSMNIMDKFMEDSEAINRKNLEELPIPGRDQEQTNKLQQDKMKRAQQGEIGRDQSSIAEQHSHKANITAASPLSAKSVQENAPSLQSQQPNVEDTGKVYQVIGQHTAQNPGSVEKSQNKQNQMSVADDKIQEGPKDVEEKTEIEIGKGQRNDLQEQSLQQLK